MAEDATRTRRGLPKAVLWLLVFGLLGAVWWLASERNLRRFSWAPDGSVLAISKGRFFPIGMARIAPDDPQLGRVYGPIPLPQGAKVAEQEFEDQTSLDRAIFDTIVPWARADVQKGDEASIAQATQLLDRASFLPGLTADQHQQLSALRGELSFTAARQDLLQAAKLEVVASDFADDADLQIAKPCLGRLKIGGSGFDGAAHASEEIKFPGRVKADIVQFAIARE